MDWREQIENLVNNAKEKVVELNLDNKKIKYHNNIKLHRNIQTITGDEEIVRAYLVNQLVNGLDYKAELIELEKKYEAGRPKTIKPRIDVILKDSKGNPFFFIEAKAPDKFESDKEYIEGQLFNLSALEESKYGTKIKYLVYYSIDFQDDQIVDRAIIIDYEKYRNYASWVSAGFPSFAAELTSRYNKPQKPPLVKDGNNDLKKKITSEELSSLQKYLHNVLWGGGGTSDTEIFYSLVNIILAKIQDESEKERGQNYDFQIFQYGDEMEKAEKVFERINELYRRALKDKLNIADERKLNKAYVINEEKFQLNKLVFTVQQLENYSFIEGRSSLNGKDLLGDFFEGITRDGFKQTKGQFFTPMNIVKFILYGLELDNIAIEKMNEARELPYIIDPACGSGTFLIEAMKMITQELKYRRKNELKNNIQVEEKFYELFMPNSRENKWAREYIYGIDINFDLGIATKVNMILHGDGSSNIFVKSGLLPFRFYDKSSAPNFLKNNEPDSNYKEKEVNNAFDVLVSNPPFSANLDDETKRYLNYSFIFSEKKNSENLFLERWYQLLKENGRLGVVLPESVFDTTENKYIRLFLYKYFKIKAVVSIPQLSFEPYTSTKTSLLFAQKKTKEEIKKWNELWNQYSSEWEKLRTRVENYVKVYLKGENKDRFPSIKEDDENTIKSNISRFLKDFIEEDDNNLAVPDFLEKYQDEIKEVAKMDKDTTDTFSYVNTWWVFGEVSKELDYDIFMAEVENVGYKRTKRGEKTMPNELFLEENGDVKIDIDNPQTVLDYIRKESIWL
jgi:type I restriction enzyme M protein